MDLRAVQAALSPPFSLDGSLGSVWAAERYVAEHVRGQNAACDWLEPYLGALIARAWREMGLDAQHTQDGTLTTAGYRVQLRRDCGWLLAPPDPLPTFCDRLWERHAVVGVAAIPWYVLANIVQAHTWADGGVPLAPAHRLTAAAAPWLANQGAWAIGGHDARLYRGAYHALQQLPWPLDGWANLEETARPFVAALRALDGVTAKTVLRRAATLQDRWLATVATRAMIDTGIAPLNDGERRAFEQVLAWSTPLAREPVSEGVAEEDLDRIAELAALSEQLSVASEPTFQTPLGTISLGEPSQLLLDRVRVRLPRGGFVEPNVKQVGGVTGLSRALRYDHTGGLLRRPRAFLAMAIEEFLWVGDGIQRAAERFVARFRGTWRVLPARHEQVRVAVPDRALTGKMQLLAIAFIAMPDGSLTSIEMRADEASVTENPSACQALAVAVAETAEPGLRRLLLGPLELVTKYGTIPMPAGYTVLLDRGLDTVGSRIDRSAVVRLRELAEVGSKANTLDLDFGQHPSFHFKRAEPPIRPHTFDIPVFGKTAKAHVYGWRKKQKFEVIAPLGEQTLMHAAGTAPEVKDNIDLMKLLERVRNVCADPNAEGHVDLEQEMAYWFALAKLRDVERKLDKKPGNAELKEEQSFLAAALPPLQRYALAQRARVARERGEVRFDRDAAERILCGALIEGVAEASQWLESPAAAIAALDARVGLQLDEILHHPQFARMEAAWRGAWWMATLAMGRRIQVGLLSVTKDELREDLEDAPEVSKSGVHHQLYERGYGTERGHPLGLVVLDHDIGPSRVDLRTLGECADVAALAHVPIVARATASLITDRPAHALDDAPSVAIRAVAEEWEALRTRGSHAMLVCGGVLLRLPHRIDGYTETLRSPADLLWGHPGLVVAARLASVFDTSGWGQPVRGTTTPPGLSGVSPVEVVLSDQRRQELAELGIATLRGADEEDAVELAELPMLSTRELRRPGVGLPDVFVSSRIAQAIKVMARGHREWSDAATLERAIRDWLSWFVLGGETEGRFQGGWLPFTAAEVNVRDTPQHWLFDLTLTPNWAERGGAFTITTTGKLEKGHG